MIGGGTDGERTELHEQHIDGASSCRYRGCSRDFENLRTMIPTNKSLSGEQRRCRRQLNKWTVKSGARLVSSQERNTVKSVKTHVQRLRMRKETLRTDSGAPFSQPHETLFSHGLRC